MSARLGAGPGQPPPDLGLGLDPQTVPGFLSVEDGAALRDAVCAAVDRVGVACPIVEIGAYCGRSTLYLAAGARAAGARVFSIDHHRGSEEHQAGEAYHDPRFWDDEARALDTLPTFRRTLQRAGVEDVVVAVVGDSAAVAAAWAQPVALLFLDGGHSLTTALRDWRAWAGRVAAGGTLAIHDVFHRPADGGRPPHDVFLRAVASGLFDPMTRVGSLTLLRRVG